MRTTRHGISRRTVTRYYYRGDGYATKAAAYQAAAKHELSNLIWSLRVEKYRAIRANTPSWSHSEREPLFREADFAVLSEMFPFGCGKSNEGINLATMWHGQRPGSHETRWCNDCRWDWIKARAKDIQAEDEQVLALPAPQEASA